MGQNADFKLALKGSVSPIFESVHQTKTTYLKRVATFFKRRSIRGEIEQASFWTCSTSPFEHYSTSAKGLQQLFQSFHWRLRYCFHERIR